MTLRTALIINGDSESEQSWGELFRSLKDRGLSGVRLVALTGWGAEDDRRKTREAGFDHHLVKPVETQELLRYLTDPR